jgi:HD-GYP domain-containing protein (c-di-GMP phosphodiesterase class II)
MEALLRRIVLMTPLSLHQGRVRLNEPLPFGVLDSEGNLLLARGMVVSTADQLQRLLERGACVSDEDLARLTRQSSADAVAQPEGVLAVLLRLQTRLKRLLYEPEANPNFSGEVVKCSRELSDLAIKNPDRVLFHVMRGPLHELANYSVTHAIQCSVASHLMAGRLNWSSQQRDSLVSAALTMNIAMTKLQDDLATQATPPTPEQRHAIQEHPAKGAKLLQRLEVQDREWLRAVQEHHETPDAKGYPRGIASTFEPAEVLRHIDVFMARAKRRATRAAIYPNEAMREVFLGNGRNHIAAALVKEFGLYPPGTFVRLANETMAIVVARSEIANKPFVAEIVNKNGEYLPTPIRRDTVNPEYAISSIVDSKTVLAYVDPEKLYA